MHLVCMVSKIFKKWHSQHCLELWHQLQSLLDPQCSYVYLKAIWDKKDTDLCLLKAFSKINFHGRLQLDFNEFRLLRSWHFKFIPPHRQAQNKDKLKRQFKPARVINFSLKQRKAAKHLYYTYICHRPSRNKKKNIKKHS